MGSCASLSSDPLPSGSQHNCTNNVSGTEASAPRRRSSGFTSSSPSPTMRSQQRASRSKLSGQAVDSSTSSTCMVSGATALGMAVVPGAMLGGGDGGSNPSKAVVVFVESEGAVQQQQPTEDVADMVDAQRQSLLAPQQGRAPTIAPQRRRSSANRWSSGSRVAPSQFTSVAVRGSFNPSTLFPTEGDFCPSGNVALINFHLPVQRSDSGGGGGEASPREASPASMALCVPATTSHGQSIPLSAGAVDAPRPSTQSNAGSDGMLTATTSGGNGEMSSWLHVASSEGFAMSPAPFSPSGVGAAPLGFQPRNNSKDSFSRPGVTHSSQLASPQFPSSTFNSSGVSLTQRFSFESQSTRTDSSRPSQSQRSGMPPSIASTMQPSGESSGTRQTRLGASGLSAPRSFDEDGEEVSESSSPATAATIPSFVRSR